MAAAAGSGRVAGLVAAAVVAGPLLLAIRAGEPVGAVVAETLAVALTQLAPGVVVWRAVRPPRGWWVEDLTIGFAVGAMLAVPAQVLAGLWGMAWPAAVVGPLVGAAVLAGPRSRRRVLAARCERLPPMWTPLLAGVVVLLLRPLLAFFALVPLSWRTGFRSTYVDMPYHLALAGELAHRGPVSMPYVTGEPLAYHWFSHAWVAQVATVSGSGLDEVMFRFMPALLTVVLPFAVGAAGLRLTGNAWAGALAAYVTMAGGDLDVFGDGVRALSPLSHLSPGLGLSALFLVALLGLLGARWRGDAVPGAAGAALVAALGLAAAGTKGSATPVVVGGLALATAILLAGRSPVRRIVALDLLLVSAGVIATYLVLFRGGSGGVGVSFDATRRSPIGLALARGGAAGTVASLVTALVVAVEALGRAAGAAVPLAARSTRRDPLGWLLAGTAAAGAGAVLLLTQPGGSQYYFLRDATPAMGLGTAAGVLLLRGGTRGRTWAVPAIAGGLFGILLTWLPVHLVGHVDRSPTGGLARTVGLLAVAAAVAGVAALLGAALLRTAPGRGALLAATAAVIAASTFPSTVQLVSTGHVRARGEVGPAAAVAFSADQVAAARWLRDHSGRYDVVATNRHCTSAAAPRCNPRRFVVSAYTERRVLVEGWSYTPTATRRGIVTSGDYWDPELLDLNDRFFRSPTAAGAQALARRHVRWLFVDRTGLGSAALARYATLRWSSRWAQVYDLGG